MHQVSKQCGGAKAIQRARRCLHRGEHLTCYRQAKRIAFQLLQELRLQPTMTAVFALMNTFLTIPQTIDEFGVLSIDKMCSIVHPINLLYYLCKY